MTKRFSILLVVLTIVSGLIGGAITGRIFTPKVAIAEEATQSKVLTVEGLRVVDKSGKLLMQLGKDSNNIEKGYGLFIYDNSGSAGAIMSVSKTLLPNGYVVGGYVGVIGKDSDAMMTNNMFSISGKDSHTIMTDNRFNVSSKNGDASMSADESGGRIDLGKDDKFGTSISGDENGGIVLINGKDANAMMSADEYGSSVIVNDKDKKAGAMMGMGEAGAAVSVQDNNGKPKAVMDVNGQWFY